MCHMKTLQDSFKDQQLIPLIIKVKKASDFKSCQVSDIQIGCEDQPFVNYSILTYYSWILWQSNSRLNAFFIKQLIVLDIGLPVSSTTHQSTSLIHFTSLKLHFTCLKLSQPVSSLFLSTWNSKEPTHALWNSTRHSILETLEDQELSLESSFCDLWVTVNLPLSCTLHDWTEDSRVILIPK